MWIEGDASIASAVDNNATSYTAPQFVEALPATATAPHAMAFTAHNNVVADDVAANAVIELENDDRIYYQTCSEYREFSLAAVPNYLLEHASGQAHR